MKQFDGTQDSRSAALLDVERTRVVHSYRDALSITSNSQCKGVQHTPPVREGLHSSTARHGQSDGGGRPLNLGRWLKLYALTVAGSLSCLIGVYVAIAASRGIVEDNFSGGDDIAPLVSRYQDLEEYFGDSIMTGVDVENILASPEGESQRAEESSEVPRVMFTSSTGLPNSTISPSGASIKPVMIRLITQKVYDVVKKYPAKMDPVAVTSLIMSESLKAGIDPLFVTSVIRIESAFDPKAKSPVGAQGLMQIMPGTKKFIEEMEEIGVAERKSLQDARYNVRLGIAYLKYLTAKYGGNRGYALMAYNWGPGNLSKTFKNKFGGKVPTSVQRYAVDILGSHSIWNSQMTRRLLFEES